MLILICTATFIAQHFFTHLIDGAYDKYYLLQIGALQRDSVLINGEYYRLLTSLFMHVNFIHLLSNLLAIVIFGSRLERYMGSLNLMFIFLLGGLTGNVVTIIMSDVASVGASGGAFALIGTLYVLTKRFNRSIDGLGSHLFFMYILINVSLGFLIPNVNNMAHIGGLIFGMIAGFIHTPQKKEVQ